MSDPHVHPVLFYRYVADMDERRGRFRDGHLAHIRREHDAGRILMAGATGEHADGAIVVWDHAGTDEIEAWVAADPYRRAGLILDHSIVDWTLTFPPRSNLLLS